MPQRPIGPRPDWLATMLHRVEGLETHPASEPGIISISVKGSNQTQFDVLSIPVLSQERAVELLRSWQDSTSSRNLTGLLLPKAFATLILGGQFARGVGYVRATAKSTTPLFQCGNNVRHQLTQPVAASKRE